MKHSIIRGCFTQLICHLLLNIGAVVLDQDFKAQIPEREDEALTLFKAMAKTYHGDDQNTPYIFMLPTWFRRRTLARKIDILVKKHIRERYALLKSGEAENSQSVLTLSLLGLDHLADDVVDQICDNLKTFLFAGHDTTSILLQWAFYELTRTPHTLKALRDELDEIFGPDPDPTIVRQKLLSGGEDIMRRMQYTSAVIKEVLRLHPPAGSARMYPKGSNSTIVLPDGKELCADNLIVYICATVIHRDPAVYGETRNDFIPERWLANRDTPKAKNDNSSASGIPVTAWRAFERGPRNCIGQELANIEARVILACAARRYDFTKVGLGEFEVGADGVPKLGDKGVYKVKSELYNVQVPYNLTPFFEPPANLSQIAQVTAKPADSLMRVKLTEGSRTK